MTKDYTMFSEVLKLHPDCYQTITKEEAKELYCKGRDVYIITSETDLWKLPSSSAYSSHAPAEELFHRSIPKYEGYVQFFKQIKETSKIIGRSKR